MKSLPLPNFLMEGAIKVEAYRPIEAGSETSADGQVRVVVRVVSIAASVFLRNAPKEKGVRLDHVVVLEDNGNNEEDYLFQEADDGSDPEDERLVADNARKPD